MLLNYKNECIANVSEYYLLATYLGNTKYFCGNNILKFFKTAEFLENIQYGYMPRYPTFWFMIRKKWFSKVKHCDSQ